MNDPLSPAPIVQTICVSDSIREAAALHADVQAHGRRTLKSAYDAGIKLREAKLRAGHGQWLEVLEKYWPNSAVVAQRYMRIARNWDSVKNESDIAAALRSLTDLVDGESKTSSATDLDSDGESDKEQGAATTSGKSGSSGGSGRSRSNSGVGPKSTQEALDFTGENAAMKTAQAALARKKQLAEEAQSACDQLLEVLPELAVGTMGPDFCELTTAAGVGPVQHKTEKGQFVGTKLVAEETYAERFPQIEKLREATAEFLKKFGETT